MLLILSVMLVAGVRLAVAYNASGNPDDTPTGTNIIFHKQLNSFDYLNKNATPEAPVYSSTLEVLVTTEAGLYGWTDINLYQYTTPGVPVTWETIITNEGNVAVTFNLTKEGLVYSPPSAGPWTCKFYNGSSWVDSISQVINDNSEYALKIRIVPSKVQTESPDGSKGTSRNFLTTGYPAPASDSTYTGVNSKTYASWTNASNNTTAEITAPVMTLYRTSEVDAPITYTGNKNDPVPGSVITYTITYQNTGAGNASESIIIDKVPNDTQGYHVNKTGAQTNVTIEALQGSATGWTVYYSKLTSPSFAYGSEEEWSSLGTITTTQNWPLTFEATYIKWEKAVVTPSEGSKTLTWGVTIK
jgi:uncharacterized repeat protein (TIGR01451 family)